LASIPYFDRIHDDAIVSCFLYLDGATLVYISSSCRRFRYLVTMNFLWRSLVINFFI
jgi:hypothetical protein